MSEQASDRVAVLVNQIERLKRSADSEANRGRYDGAQSLRNKACDAAVELCALLRRRGIAPKAKSEEPVR